MVVLLWFRRDLRLSDHPALAAAVKTKAQIIPVYIWDPPRDWPPGGASRWWLHQSLTELSRRLKGKGSRLILRRGDPGRVLQKLAADSHARQVYWNRCSEPSERRLEKKVGAILTAAGIESHSFHDGLLHEPGEVLTKGGQPYRVFTPFWRQCRDKTWLGKAHPEPKAIPAPRKWPRSLALNKLELAPSVDWAAGLRKMWTPGEAGAKARLRRLHKTILKDYAEARERPDLAGTSCLSPHLHFGEVSPRQIGNLVQGRLLGGRSQSSAAGAQEFSRQLYWREFAYDLLVHFPHLDRKPLREEFTRFPWRRDKRALRCWQKGQTGYPMVDAGMRQLWHTGWMHNRVRMLVASFLVKDLMLHWLEGARWFWDTLVDADLANNSFGWQWVAGCGADAAPYFRIFNPVTQGQRYDPEGHYVRQWIPELKLLSSRWIHCPWEAPKEALQKVGLVLGRDYPLPIVNHAMARKRALAAFQQIRGARTQSERFRAKRTPSRKGSRVTSKTGSR